MTKKKATRPAPKNPGDGTTLASPSVFDEPRAKASKNIASKRATRPAA